MQLLRMAAAFAAQCHEALIGNLKEIDEEVVLSVLSEHGAPLPLAIVQFYARSDKIPSPLTDTRFEAAIDRLYEKGEIRFELNTLKEESITTAVLALEAQRRLERVSIVNDGVTIYWLPEKKAH